MKSKIYILFLCLALCAMHTNAQLVAEQQNDVEINIDSLIQDSLSKAYILSHKPLTEKERTTVVLEKTTSAYGPYANYYLYNVSWYSLKSSIRAVYSLKRTRPNVEWIFYVYVFLFLFTAVLGKYSNGLLRKIWKVFINDGFIYRQTREQMTQQPFVSIFLNLLFVFSTSLFLFFGLGWDHEFTGAYRWYILVSAFTSVALVYVFKFIFMRTMGWAFGQEETFDNYLFVVFLNNKLVGLVLLFSSFFMAFSSSATSAFVFKSTLVVLFLMLVYRMLRGYQVFLRQTRIGFFSLILAFLSLELIPSAVVVKFLSKTIDLLIVGML
jgi:hypothetical protein